MTDVSASVPDHLLDAAGIQVDKLHMLPIIFDRLANHCAEQMRQLAASPCYFSMSHIEQGRMGELLEPYEANAVCAILDVPQWDTQVVLGFDRDFIFTIVEVMFGGDGHAPTEEDGRPNSNIELKICHKLAEMMAAVLTESFSTASRATFKLERLETRMHFAVIGRRNGQAAAAKLLVQAINRVGEMFVILPFSGLTTVRRALSSVAASETTRVDPDWVSQLQAGVTRTDVSLRAILQERPSTLGDIAALKVGSVIELTATPRTPVKLESNGQPLFWCSLGQAEGRDQLIINDIVDPEQEFIGDLINH